MKPLKEFDLENSRLRKVLLDMTLGKRLGTPGLQRPVRTIPALWRAVGVAPSTTASSRSAALNTTRAALSDAVGESGFHPISPR